MPSTFEITKPDPLPALPGTIVTRMTHEPITTLARVLQRVLSQPKDMVWIPAWRYNKIQAGARWAELLPAHHRDLRRMTWTCQEVISLFDQPELMYEALIHLAAERLVSVQNKDQ
eukprot:3133059-Rhodomonas_salina.1